MVKALPLYGVSLGEKTGSEFRKFIEKLHKQLDNDELLTYLYREWSQGSMKNYSGIERLGVDFGETQQQNNKLKLVIDFKNASVKDNSIPDLYKWETNTQHEDY